jgi:hypothetical protein
MDESAQIVAAHGAETSVVNYCCIQGWTGNLGGIGNIDDDPLFVDPNTDDCHLKSAGWRWDTKRHRWHYDETTSQCIDAGNPGSPLNDELLSMPDDELIPWGINLRINMGSYGGTSEASMPPYDWALLGDIDNDGVVDFKDFALQLQYWMGIENQQPGDLDRNGVVDAADVAPLAADWLKYIKPPVVNIVKPLNGAVFVMRPVEVKIEADAWDINGSVVKVEFFANSWKLDEDNDGSDGWSMTWTEYARGGYDLTATATDSSGITATSEPVTIKVVPPR